MARTVFLRNMSHDICTPLNAVLGFTDLALKEGTDVSKIQEYLENPGIRQSSAGNRQRGA